MKERFRLALKRGEIFRSEQSIDEKLATYLTSFPKS
jgi:hypothetical protein